MTTVAAEALVSEPIARGHVRESPRVLLAILMTTLLWASAFVAIRTARTHFAPAPLALGRLLVGCVALSGLMAARRLPLPPRRELPAIVACGVLWFGAYNIALNQGERLIDAGSAAMVVNVAPIMIALLATLVLREPLSRWLLVGLAIAFAGAAVIGVASSAHHRGGLGGVLLCVLAAAVYTVAVVIEKPVLARVSPVAVTWAACIAGVIACLPFAPGAGRRAGPRAGAEHAAGRLSRRRADGDRVHHLGLRALALDDGAAGRHDLSRAAARDHAQLDNPR